MKSGSDKKLSGLYKQQNLFYVLIFTLVTVLIWAGFSIFLSQKSTPIEPELLELAEPLNPNINLQVLQKLSQKKAYTEGDLNNFEIYTLITPEGSREKIRVTLREYEDFQRQAAVDEQANNLGPSLGDVLTLPTQFSNQATPSSAVTPPVLAP